MQIIIGVAKTRVRVRVEGKGGDGGKGENCCGNSNLDFHLKFLPPSPKKKKLSSLYFIFLRILKFVRLGLGAV